MERDIRKYIDIVKIGSVKNFVALVKMAPFW